MMAEISYLRIDLLRNSDKLLGQLLLAFLDEISQVFHDIPRSPFLTPRRFTPSQAKRTYDILYAGFVKSGHRLRLFCLDTRPPLHIVTSLSCCGNQNKGGEKNVFETKNQCLLSPCDRVYFAFILFPVGRSRLPQKNDQDRCPFRSRRTGGLGGPGIAPFAEKHLGVSIMIENQIGVGGKIAFEKFYKTSPDGYTLLTYTFPKTIIRRIYGENRLQDQRFHTGIYMVTFRGPGAGGSP